MFTFLDIQINIFLGVKKRKIEIIYWTGSSTNSSKFKYLEVPYYNHNEEISKLEINMILFNKFLIKNQLNNIMRMMDTYVIKNIFFKGDYNNLVLNVLVDGLPNIEIQLYKRSDYLYELKNNIDIFNEINLNDILVSFL